MRTIALISEKGGTAKTTTVLNLAACLGQAGRRTLVIDADPQANASLVLLQGEPARSPTIFDVLTDDAEPMAAIVRTEAKGVDLLPADATLAEANLALASELGRERRLRLALEALDGAYDVVLVDTPPTRSLLTVNALNAVGEVIIPIAPGVFGLSGLAQLWAVVEDVRRHLDNRRLRVAGLLLTMMERNNVSRDLEGQLRNAYDDLVFKTTIPRSVKLEEAHSRYEPIIGYSPRSAGARAYWSLTTEVFGDGDEHEHETDRRQGSSDGPGHRGGRIDSTDDGRHAA